MFLPLWEKSFITRLLYRKHGGITCEKQRTLENVVYVSTNGFAENVLYLQVRRNQLIAVVLAH